jgi:hypothetical protein
LTNQREHVLCAALWVDDGTHHVHQPTSTGVVFCGWRHNAVIDQASVTGFGDREQRSGEHQGFLTSCGRFVDRVEAGRIAFEAGQTDEQKSYLCSEDLY